MQRRLRFQIKKFISLRKNLKKNQTKRALTNYKESLLCYVIQKLPVMTG